ncbi:MAG: hypothetical protein JNJ40_05135 [Bacteroidia bacterium]|nr:hypothetical protein [Bacteroidia bacterium]
MVETPIIKLLKGFCSVSFGETRENVKAIFGEPEEMQTLTDDILNTSSLVYHYWDLGFSLFFDNNKNQTFTSVEIDNRDTLLFDVKLFTLKEKELVDLMKANGFALTDTETHEWGEKRISFDAAGLDCYYENHKLASANFGIVDAENNFYYFPN